MFGKLIERVRGWLPSRGAEPACARPVALGLELDITRGVVCQIRVQPFATRRSTRCIPSRPRDDG